MIESHGSCSCAHLMLRGRRWQKVFCGISVRGRSRSTARAPNPPACTLWRWVALQEMRIDISGQRSKHVDEFAGQMFDFVATLCDSAREVCPVFPGDPERIHWSFPDPGAVQGTDEERLQAFKQVARELASRLRPFLAIVERGQKRSPV